MADRPTEPASARRPYNSGREDTVVRPLNELNEQQAPASQSTDTSGNGTGKVLPPMPAGDGSSNGASRNGAPSSAAPAKPAVGRPAKPPAKPRAARPTTQPTAQPTTQPRQRTTPPAAPPAQGRPAVQAARPAAPAPPAPELAPVARTVESPVSPATSAGAAQAPDAKVKPAKPSRGDRRAEKQAQKQAAMPKPGRRARLRLTRIDPWSVMKTSFLLAIALGIVTVVSVLMVWTVLGAADVWSSINQTVQDVVGGQEASTFDIEDYLGTRRVVGFTMIVAAVDVVLVTAIATLGAFLYNMSASLLGGIEVTLAEDN
jgi:hypothetical protein